MQTLLVVVCYFLCVILPGLVYRSFACCVTTYVLMCTTYVLQISDRAFNLGTTKLAVLQHVVSTTYVLQIRTAFNF